MRQTDYVKRAPDPSAALRAVCQKIVRETDGNPSIVLFDGQDYKPVLTVLCDELAALVADAASDPSAALRELVEELTHDAERCKLSSDPTEWSVAYGIERARNALATILVLATRGTTP